MLQSVMSRAGARRSRVVFPISLLVIALAFSTALAVRAAASPMQDAAADQSAPPQRQMPSVDDQMKKLTQELTLTADQQAKIKPILEDQRTQMEAIRSDTQGTRRDHFMKMRDIHSGTVTKVKEVLNDDQKKKYDAMQEQMKEEGRKRMEQR